jgi:REP element-mobilizing transposase RayT
VLNRSAGKIPLFKKDADLAAFQRVMIEAHQHHPIRILSCCALSNHWHFAVSPERDDQVTAFFRWLAHTHAMPWRVAAGACGCCHQGPPLALASGTPRGWDRSRERRAERAGIEADSGERCQGPPFRRG